MSKGSVAIIGAGIGGLATARYLTSQGFEPTAFEHHSDLGGQWNRHNPNSGVWPQMRTNTGKFATKLSDVQYPESVALFPRNGEVLDMINDFVDTNGLRHAIRFNRTVTALSRTDDGYRIEWSEAGEHLSERFDRAVVASGRFNKPEVPAIDGLDTFSGRGGVVHAFHYKDPEFYRGMRVLVCGGSISALEVASDLSMLGTERVYLAQRRQRYVMPKMVAGTPIEYFLFTREGALALQTTDAEELMASTKQTLLRLGGDPTKYGAPSPNPDFAKAGTTGSQHYLNLVAEDRIAPRPWVESVAGQTVTFTDGSSVEVDAVVVGTGFDLNLPFLSSEIQHAVQLTRKSIALHEFTFHPELDGLAFVGLWAQMGPYPVVLEQQARFIAYTWGGAIPAPSTDELRRGVEASVREDHHGAYREQHEMAMRFARLARTDPGEVDDPLLKRVLAASAVTGEMFRIVGTDARSDAADVLLADFTRYAPAPEQAAYAEPESAQPAPL